jgi:uncharacterized membrane protein YgcG
MKKNQIVVIGIAASVVLLFFMLIYRSSGGKSYDGDTNIEIRIQTGIVLPKSYTDSLLELVNLYFLSDNSSYTQSSVSVYNSAVDFEEVACPKSGMNQLRSLFSNNFYTFAARSADLTNMRVNQAQYVGSFSKTCPVPDQNAILVQCTLDKESQSHRAAMSVSKIKSQIADALKASTVEGARQIKLYFITGVLSDGPIKEPPGGGGGGGQGGQGGNGGYGGDNNGGGNGPQPEPPVKVEAVNTQLSFQKGLPNVFTWNEQPGYTYDFSLVLHEGDKESALSVYRSDVSGGSVEVEASYAQATEKMYLATLTVKLNGKVKKTLSKVVRLVCA